MSLAASTQAQEKATIERTRAMLSSYAQRAVEILQELAEYGENERIRLSAVNSILDRAGVVAPQEIKVTATQEEHALIRSEAEETIARLTNNVKAQVERTTKPSIEAIMVHEGDTEEESAS